ncbi:hypothetical protein acdb102_03200 [Acidothermaceae bacterium B102]|nr:hypothetical protein acdb102_03200 [Acidothermaceae bacterium B102]
MSLITGRRTAGILALGASLVIPTALATPALAKDGGGHGGAAVTARGACTSTDHWQLKAKHDDGRLEVEFEVDTDRAGQVWHVAITDNGTSIASGARTTGVDGLNVEVHPADLVGVDRIRAVATRGATTCTGSISLP